MKIVLCTDDTLSFDLQALADGLNSLAPSIEFVAEVEQVRIQSNRIKSPSIYDEIKIPNKGDHFDSYRVVIATGRPYDNNYFFQYVNTEVIVSLSGWSGLTDLPAINGFVYFVAQLISDGLGVGDRHRDVNKGCIQDYLYNKRGVDTGMRAAFVCPQCKSDFERRNPTAQQVAEYESLLLILDALSQASRSGRSILTQLPTEGSTKMFDVFLCHNSDDKAEVRELSTALKNEGLQPWLDEEQLIPGRPWQDLLEQQIESIKTAAICVGNNGTGPWQDIELRAFLREFARRGTPVIPVILPACEEVPDLPLFLNQFTWVDLRGEESNPLSNLIWGITGQQPK